MVVSSFAMFGLLEAINVGKTASRHRDDMDEGSEADYVFDIQGNCDNTAVVASLSSMSLSAFDIATMKCVAKLDGAHSDRINGIEFFRTNPSILVTTSDDESVRIWDLRAAGGVTAQPVLNIRTSGEVMDVSVGPNDAMLACAIGNGVSFYDIRQNTTGSSPGSCLGDYSDVNTDFLTQVKFHPLRPSELVTAGEDGLISVFNTNVGSGEEAVTSMFNTGCPVQRFGFFGHNLEGIYSLSSIETASMWHAPSAQRIGHFPSIRDDMGIDYLVDCMYCPENDSLTLVGGTHAGVGHCMAVTPTALNITSTLNGGHNSTMRSVLCLNKGSGGVTSFLTAGEDSKLCKWDRSAAVAPKAPKPKESRKGGGKSSRSKVEDRRYSPY